MKAGFKFFSKGFIDGALAGYAVLVGKKGRDDSHIEMGFAPRRSTSMTSMTGAIINYFQFNGFKSLR